MRDEADPGGSVGREWKVSEVARLGHVTVRLLHHYDEIGLLVPSGRSAAGYRLYGEEDLARLHQILLFRELGFGLEAIGRMLVEPAFERLTALRAQRELLFERIARTESVIAAVDAAIESMEGGGEMSVEKMFEGFGEGAPYAEEARERWGDTEAYRESMRRTKRYTKEDWSRIGAELESLESRWASLLREGGSPEGGAAADLAEEHRQHISRWFYPCDFEMHTALAAMYTADARFQAHYDDRAPGLAAFVAASIRANRGRAARG